MNAVETIEQSGFTARLFRDDDTYDPRKELDHFGRMVCWHRRYNLGDEQPRESYQDWARALAYSLESDFPDGTEWDDLTDEQVIAILEKHTVMLPLYLYDHSGITMNTRGFSCPWDSGQVGVIYVTSADIIKEYGADNPENRDKARKLLVSEVEEYDQYLTGDVYGYQIAEPNGDNGDSCWGFYGHDYAVGEMKDALDFAVQHAQETAENSTTIQD